MKSEFAAYLLALAFISGCSAAPPSNPFRVARSDIQAKVKTIALAPIQIAPEVENPAAVKRKFESLITAKLQAGGYKVIASEEYNKSWNQAVEKLGAVFDPATGKRDEKKFDAALEYTVRDVRQKTKADALLVSALVRVQADFYSNMAEWHGTTDYVRPEGVWATFSGPQAQGKVGALSLWVDLIDLDGPELYVNFGGIQVTSKLYPGMKVVDVPYLEFFAEEAKNVRAVNIALNPLLGQPIPPSN
jgi:hypothetical protein